jgi:HAMP domain-containing protein
MEYEYQQLMALAALAAVLLLLMFIWVIRIGSKLKRLKKQYTAMMNSTGIQDLEGIISDLQERVRIQEEKGIRQTDTIAHVTEALSQVKGNVGMIRYNAFSDQGSDLSFSIAIVNDKQDGVVMSGIHSREETYVYAKPLERGESQYALTPEERKAINQAVQQK